MMTASTPFMARPDKRWTAIRVVVLAAVLLGGLAASRNLDAIPDMPKGERDAVLHAAVVKRITNGEAYYEATGTELRGRGYPTLSVFNWRTPLLFVVIARAPVVARGVLVGLGVLLALATLVYFARQPVVVSIVAALAQVGAVSVTIAPDALYTHEIWTGVLLGLSVWLYARERWIVAALVGVLALFVRELAAPYCVVAGLLAIRGHRWREVGVWASSACLYALYFAIHVQQVRRHLQPGDVAHVGSWVQWGGLHFILATMHLNAWLFVSPPWVSAIALTIIVAGVMDRRVNVHLRLACFSYMAFFAVVGYRFNDNWGAIPEMVYPWLFGFGLWSIITLHQPDRGRLRAVGHLQRRVLSGAAFLR